jgi:hypothetical protein
VTCYLRHLEDLLGSMGYTVDESNRKTLDKALHRAVGVRYRDCPMTWKKIKRSLAGEEEKERLMARIAKELGKTDG